MKLIITRHGETEENVKKIIQGQKIQGKLTKKGEEQARKLALRLAKEKIDIIYTSDLKRAIDTTKEIEKYHNGIPVVVTEELRERDFGELSGRYLPNVSVKEFENMRDGESLDKAYKRAEKFINFLLKKHANDKVLLVTHGGFKRFLIGVILGKKAEEVYREVEKIKNTGVTIFEIYEDKKHKIHVFNCDKHLRE